MSKTVLLCRVDGNFGGVERHILTLSKRLVTSGYRPVVVPIANHGELERQAIDAGIDLRFLPMPSRLHGLSAARRLNEIIKEENASLIHTFGIRSNLVAYLARKRQRIPWAARVPNITATDYENRWIGRLSHAFNNSLLRQADAVQVISPQLNQYYQSLFIRPKYIVEIPNGIDVDRFKPDINRMEARSILGLPLDRLYIGSTGRLATVKGFDLLLSAFAMLQTCHPDSHLLIAGDGPEHETLRRQALNLGIDDQVMFSGYQEDVRPLLWALDVYVCSSRSEGVPHSILEAMAAGVPIVSTRVGAIESVLRHNEEAVLVDEVAPEAIASAIGRILSAPEESRGFSSAALKRVERKFSEEKMTTKIIALYDELTSK